jgi:hypothetical protein
MDNGIPGLDHPDGMMSGTQPAVNSEHGILSTGHKCSPPATPDS